MKAKRELFRAALVQLAGFVTACSSPPDGSSTQACFPVPPAGAVRSTAYVGHQGTTLQGKNGIQLQGITLQGGYDLQPQGTTLQGGYDLEPQGAALQGSSLERNGRSFRLEDLNGARLNVATTNAPVFLADGTLVAEGFANTAALRGVALVATLPNGERFTVEVLAVETQAGVEQVALAIDGVVACGGGEQGVFVGGAWDSRGNHTDPPGALTYSCSSGVIAKCAVWGYAPWTVGSLRHAACTRFARADYCGDGNPWTIEGTKIGMSDSFGVRTFVVHDGYSFEAGWGPNGAVCVNHTRYDVRDRDGHAVSPSCLASLPSCHDFSEAQASKAELGTYSARTLISACE
jgi:hypothetical protein